MDTGRRDELCDATTVSRSRSPSTRLPRRSLATGVAFLLTAIAILEHLVNRTSVGALWRDEQNVVALAEVQGWREWWTLSPFETSGALFNVAFRGLARLPGGTADATLRTLGLLVGVALLGITWLAALRIGRTVPLVTLAFMAINATFVRYGDSVRAYGVGTAMAICVLIAFHAFAERPTRGRWAAALVASIVAVHTMYGNAAIVAAATIGAIVAAGDRRSRVAAAAAGAACAASLLIEWPLFAVVADYAAGHGQRVGVGDLIRVGDAALALAGWHGAAFLLVATLIVGVAASSRRDAGRTADVPAGSSADRTLAFAGTCLAVLVVAYPLFLMRSGFTAFVWHVLPPLYVSCLLLDVLRGRVDRDGPALRVGSLALCIVAAVGTLAAPSTWSQLAQRATNVDLLADAVRRAAAPDDLIVVASWERGVSFRRYYRGVTPWTTVPPLADVRVHRQDLMMAMLRTLDAEPTPDATPASVRRLIAEIHATVAAGRRVWWIGEVVPPARLAAMPRPSQAERPWFEQAYTANWFAAAEQAVIDAGGEWTTLDVRDADRVNWPERNRLLCGKLARVPLVALQRPANR